MLEAKRKETADRIAKLGQLSPQSGRYKLGDTIWVKWEADPSITNVSAKATLVRSDMLTEEDGKGFSKKVYEPLATHLHQWQWFSGDFFTRDIPNANCTITRDDKHWGNYPFVINEQVFKDFARDKGEALYPEVTFPIPVILSISHDFSAGRPYMGATSYPVIENPESMVTLYPFKKFEGHPGFTPLDYTISWESSLMKMSYLRL